MPYTTRNKYINDIYINDKLLKSIIKTGNEMMLYNYNVMLM